MDAFRTDNYVSRVPHVMYSSVCLMMCAVALLRTCMMISKSRYSKSKTCLQGLDFAMKFALDLLLTCSRVAVGERTFLPLRPRKSGHAALSGAV